MAEIHTHTHTHTHTGVTVWFSMKLLCFSASLCLGRNSFLVNIIFKTQTQFLFPQLRLLTATGHASCLACHPRNPPASSAEEHPRLLYLRKQVHILSRHARELSGMSKEYSCHYTAAVPITQKISRTRALLFDAI